MGKTDLTPKLSKELCEMLEENKSSEEIRKACDISANTFRHWIEQAILLSTQDLDAPLAQLRNAIIARVLKDTAILGMPKAASEPSENKSYKTTILSELSKSDKALLEQQGYHSIYQASRTLCHHSQNRRNRNQSSPRSEPVQRDSQSDRRC